MSSLFGRLLIACWIAAEIACPTFAQETAPATDEPSSEELTYFDLRRSKDHATKQFADRYFNLVKPQEWTSLNGKSKIIAKYVEHDPDLAWVKLATFRGAGANRTTREVTVEVAKLNKTCQSRVRQISVLQAKLDELVVAEKERETESETDSSGGFDEVGNRPEEMAGERGGRGGRAGRYGESESPAAEPAMTEPVQGASATPGVEEVVPEGSDDPDPLGFNELANELAAGAGAAAAPTGENPGLSGGGRAALYARASGAAPDAGGNPGSPDRAQWTTNYAAFHGNIVASQDAGGGLIVDWGELADLRQMNEAAEANSRDRSDASRSQVTEIADRMGEVQWEGPFAGVGEASDGRQEVLFDLPPISSPLKLRFFVDAREIDLWSAMRPGTPVKFAGRFDIREPLEIQVNVRKLD
jgi:hypothetical protein